MAARKDRADLECKSELADDSHLRAMFLACKSRGQRYLSVLIELVELMDGDRSQGWVLLPITESELQQLKNAPTN